MKDWKKTLATLAPTLATAIGGPWAGAGVTALSRAILGKEGGTEEELSGAILGATPETMAKVKKAENDFKLEMKKMNVELEALGIENTKSARQLANDTSIIPQAVLSSVFVLGFFSVLYVLFDTGTTFSEIQERLAYYLLGTLTTGVTLVLKFWFGGSPTDSQNMTNVYNSIPSEKVKK